MEDEKEKYKLLSNEKTCLEQTILLSGFEPRFYADRRGADVDDFVYQFRLPLI